MARVTFTPAVEEQIARAIAADDTIHAVLPEEAYNGRGEVLAHRDNLNGIRAQRVLYRRLIGPLERSQHLTKFCEVEGCLNPHHYIVKNLHEQRTECVNGHPYTPQNSFTDGRNRCRTCYQERLARRRVAHPKQNIADKNRGKRFCVRGHELTPDNVYITTTRTGAEKRRCRTCCIAYARRQKAIERAERRSA